MMGEQGYPKAFAYAAWLLAIAAGLHILSMAYAPVIQPIVDILPPFAIAFVIAALLDPVVDRLEKKGIARGMCVAIVGLAFVVCFLIVGFMIIPALAIQSTDLARNLPEHIDTAMKRFNELLDNQRPLLQKLNLPTTLGEFANRFSEQSKNAGEQALSYLGLTLTSALSKIVWIFIIPMATLWFLKDMNRMNGRLTSFIPIDSRTRFVRVKTAVGDVFSKYVRGMLIVAILFSVVSSIVFSLIGLNYGLVIGAIAGLLYLVPYVGVLALAGIAGVMALVQMPGSPGYAGTIVGIIVFQSFILFDLVITPRIGGGSVGVHPILALFSLTLGARLFGVVGMVVAVPCAASIQVALSVLYPGLWEKSGGAKDGHSESR